MLSKKTIEELGKSFQTTATKVLTENTHNDYDGAHDHHKAMAEFHERQEKSTRMTGERDDADWHADAARHHSIIACHLNKLIKMGK